MAKTRFIQTSFSSGVLSPLLKGRDDLEQYYKGLEIGENVVLVPQGGLKRRGGTQFIDKALHKLTRNTTAATMPEGGTAANINDDDDSTNTTTTTNISTVDPYVIAHVDLGSAKVLVVADVRGIFLTGGSTNDVRLEFSDDNILFFKAGGGVGLIGTNAQNFRVTVTSTTAHRYWQLAKNGGVDLGTEKFTLSVLSLWEESATISNLALKEFSISSDTHYLFALTEFNARIYRDASLVADVKTAFTDSQIPDVRDVQVESVMLLFHKDVEPQRIVNLGTNTDWATDTIPFINIPQFDYNDSSSPTPTSDVQTLVLVSFVDGDTMQIDIEGVLSKNITFAGDANADERSATVFNLQKNIQEMPVMGDTGVTVARTGALTYTITSAGESAKAFELFSGFPTSGTASKSLSFTHTTTGSPRKEDVWGATRGYPKTACFYEGRLVIGGTRSKPQSLLMSKSGIAFDFDTGEGDDDEAIFVTISSRKLNNIVDVFPGRNLQIFTSGSEFTINVSPVTPTTIAITPQTSHGSLNIEAQEIDGATLFIDRNGKSIKSYVFSFNEDSYITQDISVLTPELIKSPVDLDILGGTSSDDANWVFIVNGDGTVTVLNTLRAQDINGFTAWTTSGSIVSGTVVNDEYYQSNLRTVGGVESYFIELLNFDHLLDNSKRLTSPTPVITGLDHLEGEEVTILGDGTLLTSRTVSSGSVTIDAAEDIYTTYEVGLPFSTRFKPMPISTNIGSGKNVMRIKKLVRMNLRVLNTSALLIEGEPVPVRNLGENQLDTTPNSQTGIIDDVYNLSGRQRDEMPIFSQTDPGPMTILSIEYEVESS